MSTRLDLHRGPIDTSHTWAKHSQLPITQSRGSQDERQQIMALPIRTSKLTSEHAMERVQECQDVLLRIEELRKHKEEYIKQLAHCEGAIVERQRLLDVIEVRDDVETSETIESMQEDLDEHAVIVARHLRNNRALQSGYNDFILALLKDAHPKWLHQRRKSLLAAFDASENVHALIMRRSKVAVGPLAKQTLPGERKRVEKRSGRAIRK